VVLLLPEGAQVATGVVLLLLEGAQVATSVTASVVGGSLHYIPIN